MRLNKRISIYKPTKVADGLGGFTETEVLQKETWGAVKPVSQKETQIMGLDVGQRACIISVRFDLSYKVDQNFVIKYTDYQNEARTFRVVSVLNRLEKNKFLQIVCNERTD